MWPWEHAAVGYLTYTLVCHLYYRDSPGGLEAAAVVFGSVAPDLIDKPLSYQFGVFETPYAVGHSALVAVPLAVTLGLAAGLVDRRRAAAAFAVGHLLHLLGDTVPHYLQGEDRFERLLWPVGESPAPTAGADLPELALTYFHEYLAELTGPDPSTRILVQTGVVALTALVWLYDGAPVLKECYRGVRRRLAAAARNAAES